MLLLQVLSILSKSKNGELHVYTVLFSQIIFMKPDPLKFSNFKQLLDWKRQT